MPLRSLFTSICLFIICQFAGAPALYAAETQTDYAVDVVVFEDSQARYLDSEQWPAPPTPAPASDQQLPDAATPPSAAMASATIPAPLHIPPTAAALASTANSQATAPDATSSNPDIHAIDPGKYDLLNRDVRRLTVSSRYHVLIRKSWIQPGLDRDHAISIDMNSADDPDSAGAVGSLTGSVKIVLERYLHLYTDLVYHRPISDITPAGDSSIPPAPQIQDFVIKEHRRMRSNELHYLDHPLVGILIKIVPVQMQADNNP